MGGASYSKSFDENYQLSFPLNEEMTAAENCATFRSIRKRADGLLVGDTNVITNGIFQYVEVVRGRSIYQFKNPIPDTIFVTINPQNTNQEIMKKTQMFSWTLCGQSQKNSKDKLNPSRKSFFTVLPLVRTENSVDKYLYSYDGSGSSLFGFSFAEHSGSTFSGSEFGGGEIEIPDELPRIELGVNGISGSSTEMFAITSKVSPLISKYAGIFICSINGISEKNESSSLTVKQYIRFKDKNLFLFPYSFNWAGDVIVFGTDTNINTPGEDLIINESTTFGFIDEIFVYKSNVDILENSDTFKPLTSAIKVKKQLNINLVENIFTSGNGNSFLVVGKNTFLSLRILGLFLINSDGGIKLVFHKEYTILPNGGDKEYTTGEYSQFLHFLTEDTAGDKYRNIPMACVSRGGKNIAFLRKTTPNYVIIDFYTFDNITNVWEEKLGIVINIVALEQSSDNAGIINSKVENFKFKKLPFIVLPIRKNIPESSIIPNSVTVNSTLTNHDGVFGITFLNREGTILGFFVSNKNPQIDNDTGGSAKINIESFFFKKDYKDLGINGPNFKI